MENYSKLGLAPAAAAAYECIQVILGSLYIEQELGANSKLMSAITLAASTFFLKKNIDSTFDAEASSSSGSLVLPRCPVSTKERLHSKF